MTQEIQKSEYTILDKLDEEQIKQAGEALKQALVYEMKIGGKTTKQITFIGLKWLVLKMSQSGQSLEVLHSGIRLEKDDQLKQELWHWRAMVKVRNQKTGLETEGVAECPYLETTTKNNEKITQYDRFAKTKAHSKAERNAWRKQIPELEIVNLLETAKGQEVSHVADTKPNNSKFCLCDFDKIDCNPEEKKCNNCNKPMTDKQVEMVMKSTPAT